jgi:hypothetical protein
VHLLLSLVFTGGCVIAPFGVQMSAVQALASSKSGMIPSQLSSYGVWHVSVNGVTSPLHASQSVPVVLQ